MIDKCHVSLSGIFKMVYVLCCRTFATCRQYISEEIFLFTQLASFVPLLLPYGHYDCLLLAVWDLSSLSHFTIDLLIVLTSPLKACITSVVIPSTLAALFQRVFLLASSVLVALYGRERKARNFQIDFFSRVAYFLEIVFPSICVVFFPENRFSSLLSMTFLVLDFVKSHCRVRDVFLWVSSQANSSFKFANGNVFLSFAGYVYWSISMLWFLSPLLTTCIL